MKMNKFEKFAMNSPIKAFFHRHYEAPLLKKLGGDVAGMTVLEIGCGNGTGTGLIFELFGAREVHAFDIDPDMVERARTRLSHFKPDQLSISVGDATRIDAEDASFDAVIDFAILHHIPDWQMAITEIRRVLKPGGRFFFEEVTRHALERWFYRTFMVHPDENRFTGQEFVEELEKQGINVNNNFTEKFFGDFLFGVGIRQ